MKLADCVVVDDVLRLGLCCHDGIWTDGASSKESSSVVMLDGDLERTVVMAAHKKLMVGGWYMYVRGVLDG